MNSVGVAGTGMFLPEKILTNHELEKIVDTNHEWILTRTGIEARRIADEETRCSDLCYKAGVKALEDAGISPEELDLVIVTTVTPDYLFPSTACLVAERLGAKRAAAFDLEAGCTGFVYGMVTASQFIATGLYQNALVIGGEVLSKIVDWEDRATCILFGDGAGAAVLTKVPDGYGILASELGADGAGGSLLTAGEPLFSAHTGEGKKSGIKMAGREVFKFAVRVMEEVTLNVLEKAGVAISEVDLVVPHQANIRIIDAAVKRLNMDPDRVLTNLDRYGNMSAASIPVALDEAVRAGRLKDGDLVLLVGFGAGLTWGATLIRWHEDNERVIRDLKLMKVV